MAENNNEIDINDPLANLTRGSKFAGAVAAPDRAARSAALAAPEAPDGDPGETWQHKELKDLTGPERLSRLEVEVFGESVR